MKKIILSGGWGYGNMGDDAILIASINLLRNKFQPCQITVLTSNVIETENVISENDIIICQDLYNTFFADKNSATVNSITKRYALKIKRYLYRLSGYDIIKKKVLVNKYLGHYTHFMNKKSQALNVMNKLFEDSDMYIMSGGGYLNGWVEMGIIKHVESLIAKKNKLKMYSIGNTIGPFKNIPKAKIIVGEIMEMMDGVFFRDDDSINELGKKNNIMREKIPDIAFYDISYAKTIEIKDRLIFIPFITSDFKYIIETLVTDFKRIQKENRIKIVVLITQSWEGSINLATTYYLYFKQCGIDVDLIIPNNVFELEKELSKAVCVISQNLHGLILAYRQKIPVISLNMRRKFIGFMKEIDCGNLLLNPMTLSTGQIYKSFVATRQIEFNKQEILKKKISNAFDSVLQ